MRIRQSLSLLFDIIIINNNIRGQADVTSSADTYTREIDDPGPIQQPLMRMTKKRRARPELDIDKIHSNTAYDICYGASTMQGVKLLSAQQRGRVANALTRIAEAGGDLNQLRDFEQWWKMNWRSGTDGNYQFPRPENIAEFWFEAMSAFRPERPNPNGTERVDNLDEKMRAMALKRKGD